MKLITEEISKVEFVVEGTGSKKKMFIEGVFLQGDIKNRNGRMYPMSTLEKEVGRYQCDRARWKYLCNSRSAGRGNFRQRLKNTDLR